MAKTTNKSELFVAAYDLHYPHVDWASWKAMLQFIRENEVSGFVFGGDQFSNDAISHHTKGKPMLRNKGEYKRDERGFTAKILDPLEEALGKKTQKIWIQGNHDNWEDQLVETQPELDGIQRGPSPFSDAPGTLGLREKGWTYIACGERFKKGKVAFIHGETLTGIGNQGSVMHSRKAVETYCNSVVYGHMHAPQSFTKVLPHDTKEKWMGYCMPTLGNVNPYYLRNRPTAWLNGFGIVEFQSNGNFNVYTVIVCNGKFSFGGKTYGAE